MQIRIENFSGILPKVSARLLPSNNATASVSTELYSGELRGLKAPFFVREVGITVERVFSASVQVGDDWLKVWVTFTDAGAEFYRGPNINDEYQRHYYSGTDTTPQVVDGALLQAADGDLSITDTYLWGIPRPIGAPTAAGPAYTVSDPTETRSYAYTFVNEWGEESAPSDPSVPEPGHASTGAWTITGIDDDYGVSGDWKDLEFVRIYRTITGTSGNADFRFVAEVAVGALSLGTYSDTVPSTQVTLNESLTTTNFEPAPGAMTGDNDNIDGIVELPNGFFAGFIGSDVYFSEPYKPWAWPRIYTVSVGDRIIGLGVHKSGLVVATESNPKVISGAHPAAMTMVELDQAEPCKSRRSIVSSAGGVFYVSQNGVVLANEYGAQVISAPLISRKEWQTRYSPETMHAAVNGQGYIAVYSPSQGTVIGTELGNGAMVDIGNISYVKNLQTNHHDGEIYMLRNGNLFQWNVAEARPLPYLWESKTFETPFPLNFAVFQLKWDTNAEVTAAPVAIDYSAYNAEVWDYTDTQPNDDTDGIHTFNQFALANSSLSNDKSVRKVDPADLAADEFYPDVVKMPMGGSDIVGKRTFSLDAGVRVSIFARMRNSVKWELIYQRIITDEEPHNLKSTYKADLWRVRLESSNNIYSFAMGEKGSELADV